MNRYYKAFHEAFDLLVDDYRKNKKYLEDKRLTHAERQILHAHMAIRNNKNHDVFDLLENCTPKNEYFIAHKNLTLGMAYINTGKSHKALEYFELCIDGFIPEIDHYFIFLLYRNCYSCALNLNDKNLGSKYFDLLMTMPAKSDREKKLLDLTRFHHSILMEDLNEAQRMHELLDPIKDDMSPSDLPNYLINCFHLSMLLEDFNMAFDIIGEMKLLKKFHRSENYKFMHSLTSYLVNDSPIYLREEDLESIASLNYQTQCIKLLSAGDIPGAFSYWQELAKLNPQIYQDEFDYKGNKNLFSLCLKKSLRQVKKDRIELPQTLTMFEKLDFIFEHSNKIISKEELFLLLWNKELYDKDDLQKLSRLIYKYRKSAKFEVKTYQGSYKISAKKAA